MGRSLRIVGIADEDPFDPLTWSGSSQYFFKSLQRQNVFVDAVGAEPSYFKKIFFQLSSFHPNLSTWKRRYHLNTSLFDAMSNAAYKKIVERTSEFDILLQIGAWYNFSRYDLLRNKFRCSYHDGNLAAQVNRIGSEFNINKVFVKRAFAYEKSVYDSMHCIFTMSEWLRRIFIDSFNCDPQKVISVGAGINFEHFPEIYNKSYSNPNILFIGVDFERKGGRVLLEAFQIVKREIPKATLTIIGPELKISIEGVNFLGRIKKTSPYGEQKLHDAYLNATIFVMPSIYEPFGIVLAEAMAHKLPCIGTSTCAIPEIINHGESGFIVPVNDSKALSKEIITLLKDSKLCEQFGYAGFEKFKEHYTWEKVTQKIISNINMYFE